VPTLILHVARKTHEYTNDHRLLVSFKVALLALLGTTMPLLWLDYEIYTFLMRSQMEKEKLG